MNHRDISLTLGCSLLLLMTYPVVKSVIMLHSGFFENESLANGALAGFLVTGLFSTVLGACAGHRAFLYGACAGLFCIAIMVAGLSTALNYFWAAYVALVLLSTAWAHFGYTARRRWFSRM